MTFHTYYEIFHSIINIGNILTAAHNIYVSGIIKEKLPYAHGKVVFFRVEQSKKFKKQAAINRRHLIQSHI